MRTIFVDDGEDERDSIEFGRESEPTERDACVALNNDRKLDPDTAVKYDVPLLTGERQPEGHTGISGLARHSVGELYPWGCVLIGNSRIQPRQLISGAVGPVFGYSENGFNAAYTAAEKWIADHKGLPNPAKNQPTAADVL